MLAACGSTKSNTVDAPATGSDASSTIDALTADQACTTLASDRCQKLQSCSPVDLEKRFGDISTCEEREKLACTDALAAPNTGNTPEDTLACGFAVSQQACADFLTKDAPNACLRQMGTLTGACAFAAQCTTAFCAIDNNTLCGTCAAAPTAGTSCANSGCGQGLICVAATQLCQVPRTVTQACDQTQPCANGLTCVGATPTATGTCTVQATTVGATCDPTHKTAADCNDDDGLTCDAQTDQCVTQPIATPTQPCGLMAGIRTACADGALCTAGTCVAPAADNGACDTAAGPGCLFPARCIVSGSGTAGTCELPGSMTCQ